MDALLQVLANAALSPDAGVRAEAAQQLEQRARQPGLAPHLLQMLLSPQVEVMYRQLAGTTLKTLVRQHWSKDAPLAMLVEDQHVLGDQDRATVRVQVLSGVQDPNHRIRSLVCAVAAEIARQDLPHHWPDLIPSLLSLVQSSAATPTVMHAGLRAINMVVNAAPPESLPALLSQVAPTLFAVFSRSETPARTRRVVVAILTRFIRYLSYVTLEDGADDVSALLDTLLPTWTPCLVDVLQSSTSPGLKMEVLSLAASLVHHYGSDAARYINALLVPVHALLSSGRDAYQRMVIEAEPGAAQLVDTEAGDPDAGYYSDQDVPSLDGVISAAFEFLVALLESHVFGPALIHEAPALLPIVLPYLQLSNEWLQVLQHDASAFMLADDDEVMLTTVRAAASVFLDTLFDQASPDLAPAVTSVADQAMAAADASSDAWRLREAALTLLVVAAPFLTGEVSGGDEPNFDDDDCFTMRANAGSGEPIPVEVGGLDIDKFLREHLPRDLAESSPLPLRAAALRLAGAYAAFAAPAVSGSVLQLLAEAMGAQHHILLRLSACRAAARLLPNLGSEDVRPHVAALLSALAALADDVSQQVLFLVLETIEVVIQADPSGVLPFAEHLCLFILRVWQSHLDAETALSLTTLLDIVVKAGAEDAVYQHVFPHLINDLVHAADHLPGVVEWAVEIVSTVLARTRAPLRQEALAALDQLLPILLTTNDRALLLHGSGCVREFLGIDADAVVSRSYNGEPGLQLMCKLIARLLDPTMNESVCVYVGSIASFLVVRYPQQLGPQYTQLITRLVLRRLMYAKSTPSTQQELVLFYARLINCTESDDKCAELLQMLHADQSGLATLMQRWIALESSILGKYQVSSSTMALGRLFSLSRSFDLLQSIQVSRPYLAGRQDTGAVPLPHAMLIVLVQRGGYGDAANAASDKNPNGPFVPAEYYFLSDLLDEDGSDVDTKDDDPTAVIDPASSQAPYQFVPSILASMMQQEAGLFATLIQQLTNEQMAKLKGLLAKAGIQ